MGVKEDILDHIIKVEGSEYTDNPDDSGGPTKYGITEAVARKYNYTGDMRDLTEEEARDIYEAQYWLPIWGSYLATRSEKLAKEMIDTAVNQGVYRASKYLQRGLNVLNNKEEYYKDIKVDGNIGPKTMECFDSYMIFRDNDKDNVLLNMLNCMQGEFYVSLAERREKDETFVYGWFKNRVIIE